MNKNVICKKFILSMKSSTVHTSLYCRDYVPLDILPSDVGGDKNAPLMVSLPPDSFLLNVGVSLPECELRVREAIL